VPVVEQASCPEAGVKSFRTGLLGREILASRSPWIHQQEAAAQGIDLSYQLFDFTAAGWGDEHLSKQLEALRAEGFAGLNVTHPFKQMVIPFLDELSTSAANVGAVNTVRFADGKSIGHNTDVSGFADSVRRGLVGADLNRVVQFGAGGGGSATAFALLSLGVSTLMLVDADQNRRTDLAERLALAYPAATILAASPAEAQLSGFDGVVNATPMGMAAHPGMAVDPDLLSESMWVADIVYFPLETALLKAAHAKGCRVLDGRGMAVFQAADAFEIFTGKEPDRQRMLASFDAFVAEPTR
jgi:shikimate dehydrogenase